MAANTTDSSSPSIQDIETEKFFYFFLRLRKGEIRRTVQSLQTRYPDDTPHQLANRLIGAQAPLSFLSGSLLQLPMLLPGIGQALKVLGFVGGTATLTRMHLYLILEIALAFGKDIDDQARISEMVAVVAATSLAPAATMVVQTLEMLPILALPAGGLTATALSQMIGQSAIRYYSGELEEAGEQAEPATEAAGH